MYPFMQSLFSFQCNSSSYKHLPLNVRDVNSMLNIESVTVTLASNKYDRISITLPVVWFLCILIWNPSHK